MQSAKTRPQTLLGQAHARLMGRRAVMATFSHYPGDPRPRRAVQALLDEGMSVDLICLADGTSPRKETSGRLRVHRVPMNSTRGGKLHYAYKYSVFIFICGFMMAKRLLAGRYHLAYIHNMPDVLVFSALGPKLFGAKVILDQHDPMPELMTTIYGLSESCSAVRLMKFLEKLSFKFADAIVTVNVACKRIFSKRSCAEDKITIVMNSPDERIFSSDNQGETLQGESREKFVVMYHGSLVERNGLDLAVLALARLQDTCPEIELRVYGKSTPYLEKVLRQASELGLADSVRHLGPRRLEDLPREIQGCTVGVIPNQKNSFTDINTPTRIFEYLAVGRPVIAPRTQGIVDYFDDGSLIFFESGNVEDLAARIKFVYDNRRDASAIAARGQQVLNLHTWSQERETLISLVDRLVNGTAGSRNRSK